MPDKQHDAVITAQNISCRLCHGRDIEYLCRDDRRPYYRCGDCGMIFVPPDCFPSPDKEKSRYDLHRNNPDDEGYLKFLDRLFQPVARLVKPGSRGLDFGSGPSPVLAAVFEQAGYAMTIYDKFYAPRADVLDSVYDFITACEVLEHLQNPRAELDRLWNCLRTGGVFGFMTSMVPENGFDPQWHYARDITHLCFYSPRVFDLLAMKWNARFYMPAPNVGIFTKRPE